MMKRIKDFLTAHKNALNITIIFVLFLTGLHIFNLLNYKYISIQFYELRPIHERINVFYKGIKVGYVRKMDLCHECNSTMAKTVLTYKGLKLPANMEAKLKKEKKKNKEFDFIELIYPKKPLDVLLGNGFVIKGTTTVDLETFMANQDPDDLETIRKNLAQSSEELQNTLSALSELFVLLQDVVKENQKNISNSTYNLSQTTKNFSRLSEKFDTAVKQQQLNNSVSNIDTSIANLAETTKTLQTVTGNFNNTSTSLNNTTMPQIQSTLYRTECLVANVNEITCGVKETLKKRFGGLRLIFGKVIPSQNVKTSRSNCCSQ